MTITIVIILKPKNSGATRTATIATAGEIKTTIAIRDGSVEMATATIAAQAIGETAMARTTPPSTKITRGGIATTVMPTTAFITVAAFITAVEFTTVVGSTTAVGFTTAAEPILLTRLATRKEPLAAIPDS